MLRLTVRAVTRLPGAVGATACSGGSRFTAVRGASAAAGPVRAFSAETSVGNNSSSSRRYSSTIAAASSSSSSSSSSSGSTTSSSSSGSSGTTTSDAASDAGGPPPPASVSAVKEPVIDSFGRAYGTGRRKTSVARVWIKEGSGQFVVNDNALIDYFQPIQREHALGSLLSSNTAGYFDVWCTVKGGGLSGQAGAIRLGIARALEAYDPHLRTGLSQAGMLTRDSRRVERKKPGQKKARKQFQWVKR